MFKILLWVTISVILTACQMTEDNKSEEKPIIQGQDVDKVLELHYDEKQQKLVFQETTDIESENIVDITEKALPSTNDTRIQNNNNVVVNYEDGENKDAIPTNLVEPIGNNIVVVPSSDFKNTVSQSTPIQPTKTEFPSANNLSFGAEQKTIKEAPNDLPFDFEQKKIKEALNDLPFDFEQKKMQKMLKVEELKTVNLEGYKTFIKNKDNGTGIDVVFGKEEKKLDKKAMKPKYNLGSSANVIFDEKKVISQIDTKENSPIIVLPMDVKSLANRKQPILEAQLKKQYKKEKKTDMQKHRVRGDNATNKISRDIFDQFSQEINKDMARLENIKKSYQNVDKNTININNNNNDDNAALRLLQNTYDEKHLSKVTDISLESIKDIVDKRKKNKNSSNHNFLNQLLKLQSRSIKPIEKKQYSLLTLNLSNVQKVIEEREDALRNDTKMWQSIDIKSNQLVQKRIKNNKHLKRKLEILKKRLNSTGILKMSKAELRGIIEQLNQLDTQLNRSKKIINKQVNQKDINKLLQELKKMKY